MNLIPKIFVDVFQFISLRLRSETNFFDLNEQLTSIFLYLKQKSIFPVANSYSFHQAVHLLEEEAVTLLEKNGPLVQMDAERIQQQAEDLKSMKLLEEAAILEKNHVAATVLQKAFRKYLDVRHLQKEKHAAAMQLVFQEQKQKSEQKRAATMIQKNFRHFAAQAKLHLLPLDIFQQSIALMDSVDVKQFPASSCGQTPVYFHPDLPIIFKESGSPENKKRLEGMIQAREVCQKNNFSSLVIPEARIHGDFIIERCLPLKDGLDQKKQVGLYIEGIAKLTRKRDFSGLM